MGVAMVRRVFDFWVWGLEKRRARLSGDRAAKIRARLKEGYHFKEIARAIVGCAKSKFHQGQNERGTVYNDLVLICRSGSKLESFMDMATEEEAIEYLAAFTRERGEEGTDRIHQARTIGRRRAIRLGAKLRAAGLDEAGNQVSVSNQQTIREVLQEGVPVQRRLDVRRDSEGCTATVSGAVHRGPWVP